MTHRPGYWKEYYAKNRSKIIARATAWQRDNKGRKLAQYRARTYGVTEEIFTSMMEAQGGACSICLEAMRSPQIDHCHRTGVVRGLLCVRCNLFLGKMEKMVHLLARFITYMDKGSNHG